MERVIAHNGGKILQSLETIDGVEMTVTTGLAPEPRPSVESQP
ncbi:MAG: hypothetical protein WHS46_02430 [Desulfosoma sp.]